MLLVTTTMGMVDGVHSNTSNTGPSVSLGLVLPVRGTGLKHGLIGSLSTGDNTNHGSAGAENGLTDTGGESHSGLFTFLGVTNDNSGSAGSSGKGTSVTVLGLDVGANSAFGHGINWQDVANGKKCFLSTVDVHSSVHSFNSDEILMAEFVFVLVSEDNLGEGGTSTAVVDDVSHDTLDVALSFGEIKSSEASWCNSLRSVRLEDCGRTVTLRSDNFSH